jgi:ribosome-associated translation inhibitor RaiA
MNLGKSPDTRARPVPLLKVYPGRSQPGTSKEAIMELPLQLQFRNLDHSPAIEAAVRKHVDKLKSFNGDIISCRVAIESPHKHQYKGKLYHVVVDVRVPGKEIVVSRAPDDQQAHEDVYVAIRDAFDAARRQIQDYVRIRRGKVKAHVPPTREA